MSDREISYLAQAEAVALVSRHECLKAIRCRDAEADMILKRLAAAAATLLELAHKARTLKGADR